MVGQLLGPYRIDAEIGAGGMGLVYRAYDVRLERPVAIKVLRDDGARGSSRRLLREARNASRLNHPGICTVHDVGEHGGTSFIVMELVEGQPLADLIPSAGLTAEKLLSYAAEIATAVAHAHEQGVLHRDLKPANVMVLPSGRIKILDFGIAQFAADDAQALTRSLDTIDESPAVRGTLPYLPPEILNGRPADTTSDVWSLGVLLYEMAAGCLPFERSTSFAMTSAILTETPAPLPSRVPHTVTSIVHRCLEKDPSLRYRTAREVQTAIESARSGRPGGGKGDAASRAIAVLPFKNLAQRPEDSGLGLGLADAIITELAGVRALVVRPTSAIVRYVDAADPVHAPRELGVDAVVEGSFQQLGSRLRVTVQLSDIAEGRSLWGTSITTTFDDLFTLQDELSRQIASALKIELTAAEEGRQGRSAQPGLNVYEHYLRGRARLLTEHLDDTLDSVASFERAISADPSFAQAWAGLSDACLRMAFTFQPDAGWYERAERACAQALALNPELPEGQYLRGRLVWTPQRGFQHAEAIRAIGSAISRKPNLNEAHHWLGIILMHVGLLPESEFHFESARRIAPDDVIAFFHVGYCRYLEGDFVTARDIAIESRMREPGTHWINYQRALAEIQLGALDRAEQVLTAWSASRPDDVLQHPIAGLLAALRGDTERADHFIRTTVAAQRSFGHYHHAQYDIGCIYALTGRLDAAVDWVRRSALNGFPCAPFIRRDPLLAALRSDGRFLELLNSLDVECAGYAALYNQVCEPPPPRH